MADKVFLWNLSEIGCVVRSWRPGFLAVAVRREIEEKIESCARQYDSGRAGAEMENDCPSYYLIADRALRPALSAAIFWEKLLPVGYSNEII